jgi:hypothetical protein
MKDILDYSKKSQGNDEWAKPKPFRDSAHMGVFLLKRFALLAFAAMGISPAFGYGTIPYSLTQQFGSDGKPLVGGLLYFYQAGTVATPQNCYQDTALSIAWPNPITLDSAGRIPQLFCADGSIKVRLTNSAGVTQVVADNILVVGGSGGGGGGGSVDATTILATGDFKTSYGTGALSGFVRCNGRTIGSATSGASERANADTSALFAYLWTNDTNLTVSSGRGATAAADFAANKTITLPDCRGRTIAGLDDMGNSAASLTSTYFGTSTTVLGAASTTTDHVTLATTNLPPYTPAGSVAGGLSVPTFVARATGTASSPAGGALSGIDSVITETWSGTFSGSPQGGVSTPFSNVSPTILMTVYIKL